MGQLNLAAWRHGVQRLLPPGRCRVCDRWPQVGPRPWCEACAVSFADQPWRCARCASPLPAVPRGVDLRCGACRVEAVPQVATLCAWAYAYPWAGLIQSWKYHGDTGLTLPLAQALAATVRRREDRSLAPIDALVPVPTTADRLRHRGFHATLALARALGKTLQLPVEASWVRRSREAPHQTGMDRAERLRAVQAAFAVEPAAQRSLVGRRVALIDDVMTTGATAQTLARTLLLAGSREVQVWVLARTDL